MTKTPYDDFRIGLHIELEWKTKQCPECGGRDFAAKYHAKARVFTLYCDSYECFAELEEQDAPETHNPASVRS